MDSAPQAKLELPPGRSVLMIGTDPQTRGGIAAVISCYRSGGLFDHIPVTLISTHQDGSRGAKAMRFGRAVLAVIGQLTRRRAALVHAHVSSRASFWRKSMLLLLARSAGVPTVFHLHSGGFAQWAASSGRFAGLRRWWIRHTLQRSDRVILLTQRWADWMSGFAPRSRIAVLGNPVQIPAQTPWHHARGSDRGAGRVLFLGWIYDFKGVFDLLNAWVVFRERCPGWRLVVGGKGEVDAFLDAARQLGIAGDLEFLGWVSGEAKERELRQADIFVLPSYSEGMPVSLLEAMAYGVAVATTPVGGVPDMMEPGVHGLWMQPGDIAGISGRLVELATSPGLRSQLAQAAYAHVVAHYSVECATVELLKVYRALLHRPSI